MKYDLIVIGGGPAGYTGAIRAAKLGMRVALVEENYLGGTCLNRGCIPTKVLLHSGEIYRSRGEWAELGISADNIRFDEERLYERKRTITKTLREGVESLVRANKIDFFRARGKILDKNTVLAGEDTLSCDFILIATGSRPAGLDPQRPINGIENALSSDDVLEAPVGGASVAIVGAGVIGIELATYFSSIGKSVTLLAPSERIAKMMSKDISVQLSAVLKKSGVKIVTNAKIIEVTPQSVQYDSGSGTVQISADAVIAALGRKANIESIGLENLGIKVDRYIKVDQSFCTGINNIYACGDVIGGIQLAHYAAACAITAVESMLGRKKTIDLSVVPSCIYTSPEIAAVGKKEDEVEGARIGKFLMGANGKAIIEGMARGFVKIVADKDDRIVGAEIFAVRATDIIGELALAISRGLTISEAASVIHAHPTVYEAVLEAYEDIEGLATHLMPKRK